MNAKHLNFYVSAKLEKIPDLKFLQLKEPY